MQEGNSLENKETKFQPGKAVYITAVVLGVLVLLWALNGGGSDTANPTNPADSVPQTANENYSEGINLGPSDSGFSQNQGSSSLQQGGTGLQGTGGQLQSPTSREDPVTQSFLQD